MSGKDSPWNEKFGPCYTPEEMLKLGVFEGKYINNIKGIPSSWKSIDKVLGPKDEPDPKLNHFGLKSRQPLSVWNENGWIKTDKNGWFEWYIHYFLGRRLGAEDKWQIGRWNSFVARHQGQIKASCSLTDKDCRPIQRQGLLQWGWDSSEIYTPEKVQKNAQRLAKITSSTLDSMANEKYFDSKINQW